jgi:hypothetical protein
VLWVICCRRGPLETGSSTLNTGHCDAYGYSAVGVTVTLGFGLVLKNELVKELIDVVVADLERQHQASKKSAK